MGEMVTIPVEEYRRLLALAAEVEDAAAVATFRARLAAGEEELAPAAVVDRLLAGENPVRVWRQHRGLTQSGLARTSGVHRVVIADIETGRRGGSVRSLKALAGALGVAVDEVV